MIRTDKAYELRVVFLGMLGFFLVSCAGSPPLIGRDLPAAFAEARPVFSERLVGWFPVGSSEQALTTELTREGFTVIPLAQPDPYQFRAAFTAHQLVCRLTWTVVWSASDMKITAVAGNYDAVCL